MKDSIAKARQIRVAEQTQAEVAEIKAQLDRIEAKLGELLLAASKPAADLYGVKAAAATKKPAEAKKAGA